MGFVEFFGIDKLAKLPRVISQIGGVRAAIKQRYLMDQTRAGRLVGVDSFGNRYFEDPEALHPRNRWVAYAESKALDYDASQVPPEWHRWLHHLTDVSPTERPPENPRWVLEHRENLSIVSRHKYVPYSTTRTKIQGWQPDQPQQQ